MSWKSVTVLLEKTLIFDPAEDIFTYRFSKYTWLYALVFFVLTTLKNRHKVLIFY